METNRKETPAVSVIVPVYNTESYVAACLDSLLNQTLRDIEIICVNDGSTDGTGDLLRAYASRDARVRVVNQENHGQAHARNVGLAIAEGAYCCFVDSDDTLAPEALERLCLQARQENLDALFFAGQTFFATDQLSREHPSYFDQAYSRDQTPAEVMSGREMLRRQREVRQYWRTACMVLLRVDFLRERRVCFREGIHYEDNLFTYTLLLLAERCASVPDVYYHRLLRDESDITVRRTGAHLYGYVTTIVDEISLLQKLDNPAEREPFYQIIDDTLRTACTVWTQLDEAEREKAAALLTDRRGGLSELDLYRGLILPALETEARRREGKQLEKTLWKNLRETKESLQRQLQEEQLKTHNAQEWARILEGSAPYRLGSALLAPARKIRTLFRREKA